MIYNFKGIDKIRLSMGEDNREMVLELYDNKGKLISTNFLMNEMRPFEVYLLFRGIYESGAKIFTPSTSITPNAENIFSDLEDICCTD